MQNTKGRKNGETKASFIKKKKKKKAEIIHKVKSKNQENKEMHTCPNKKKQTKNDKRTNQ